jgi:hypothetical protein
MKEASRKNTTSILNTLVPGFKGKASGPIFVNDSVKNV